MRAGVATLLGYAQFAAFTEIASAQAAKPVTQLQLPPLRDAPGRGAGRSSHARAAQPLPLAWRVRVRRARRASAPLAVRVTERLPAAAGDHPDSGPSLDGRPRSPSTSECVWSACRTQLRAQMQSVALSRTYAGYLLLSAPSLQMVAGWLAHVRRRATSVLASASTSASAFAAPHTAACTGAPVAGRGGVDASVTSCSSRGAGCGDAAPRHRRDHRAEAGGVAAWERAPLGTCHPGVWGGRAHARAYSAVGGGAAVETEASAKATRKARRTPKAQAGLGEAEEGCGTGAAPGRATAEAQQKAHRRANRLEQMMLRAAERRDFAEVRCRPFPFNPHRALQDPDIHADGLPVH